MRIDPIIFVEIIAFMVPLWPSYYHQGAWRAADLEFTTTRSNPCGFGLPQEHLPYEAGTWIIICEPSFGEHMCKHAQDQGQKMTFSKRRSFNAPDASRLAGQHWLCHTPIKVV